MTFFVHLAHPEPKAEGSGSFTEITCRPTSFVRSYVRSHIWTVTTSPLKLLGQFSSNCMWNLLLKGVCKIKIIFSRTKKILGLNLGIEHWSLKVYQVCSNDDRRLTFDFLRQGQICDPIYLYLENVEKPFSQNVLKTNGWNLQCMI